MVVSPVSAAQVSRAPARADWPEGSALSAALRGRVWDEAALREAMTALASDYAPLSDMRASSGYRMKAAQNLLRRFWFETRSENPLAADRVNAFA